ncbi:MAG: hypothetical protein KVP17_001232 [Porospora cf. gigantea B]|uniref:uncharacterized protein n=1 Tax=Porospora cf. gigantea B TaxID=2853592 RepID=UPI003571D76B|nr:MAG: hypothetical protein KVP17_001232 [Porospora cf. gigantea B]
MHSPPPSRLNTAQSSGILSERVVETEIRVPRKVVKEEIVEKVIVVPEKVVREEIVETVQVVREKIIEIAKPIIQEKIVEVPEYEYIEKIIEIPEIEYIEHVKHVPKIEIQEKIVHIPKIIPHERIVEVADVEYREYDVEKIVEVPEVRQEYVNKQVPVPQYVDRPYANHLDVEVPQRIDRNIPVPVEAVTTFEFQIPQLKPIYNRKELILHAPRFVEVPVPAELMDEALQQQALQLQDQVHLLADQPAPSLAEVEQIAEFAKNNDFQAHISASNFQRSVEQAWKNGTLKVTAQPHTIVPDHQQEHKKSKRKSKKSRA